MKALVNLDEPIDENCAHFGVDVALTCHVSRRNRVLDLNEGGGPISICSTVGARAYLEFAHVFVNVVDVFGAELRIIGVVFVDVFVKGRDRRLHFHRFFVRARRFHFFFICFFFEDGLGFRYRLERSDMRFAKAAAL